VRRARSLPAALRKEIEALSFAYTPFVPEFLTPSPASGFREFDEELQELDRFDDATLALGFLRQLWDHRGERDEALLADERVREHIRRGAEQLGADHEAALLIFDDPRALAGASRSCWPPTGRRRSSRNGSVSSRAWRRPSRTPAGGSPVKVSTRT
jgi:hypothetical protein